MRRTSHRFRIFLYTASSSIPISAFPSSFFCFFIALLPCLLFLSTCRYQPLQHLPVGFGFKPVKAEFNFGDSSKFEFETNAVISDGQTRLLMVYIKHHKESRKVAGKFFRISMDSGVSFASETPISVVSSGEENIGVRFLFTEKSLAAVYSLSGNIFYTLSKRNGEEWTPAVQINDEQNSFRGLQNFLQPSPQDIYCVWQDQRRGFPLTYFSASYDGGRTWTANQPVEFDFREGNQTSPKIVSGANGRLLAFWEDWRDRQTLVDIRCAYSDDQGRHWSPSQKVNDDEAHVWQVKFEVVAKGNHLFVVFQDFREAGEQGDNDWNIYFARSQDNGRSWEKNLRLNDVKEGLDAFAQLAIDPSGTLFCLWQSGRNSIFGDVVFSYSTDEGASWSPSKKITEAPGLLICTPVALVCAGRTLCFWQQESFEQRQGYFTWLEPLAAPELAPTPQDEISQPSVSPLEIETGGTIFSDDFANRRDAQWQVTDGVWMLTAGAYMGVNPDAPYRFASFARIEEPESYILRGQFMLDPVNHFIAVLYFHAGLDGQKHYSLVNQFRVGSWLSLKEVDAKVATILNGRPLVEHRFPFQNNRWYEFKLVVTPSQVDYYVDGRLLLSYAEKLILPPGRIGIGGFAKAPTYFKDITISKIHRRTP